MNINGLIKEENCMAITLKKISAWEKKKKESKLLKALSDPNIEIQVTAIKALGKVGGEKSMNTLITLLRNSDPVIRSSAVEALGTMANPRSEEFVKQISLNDSDENVRQKAVEALNKIKKVAMEEEAIR